MKEASKSLEEEVCCFADNQKERNKWIAVFRRMGVPIYNVEEGHTEAVTAPRAHQAVARAERDGTGAPKELHRLGVEKEWRPVRGVTMGAMYMNHWHIHCYQSSESMDCLYLVVTS